MDCLDAGLISTNYLLHLTYDWETGGKRKEVSKVPGWKHPCGRQQEAHQPSCFLHRARMCGRYRKQYPPANNPKPSQTPLDYPGSGPVNVQFDNHRVGLNRTPSPTPSEAKELSTGAIDFKSLMNWRFWIRRQWLCA